MDNQFHPLEDTIKALGSSFSHGLIHPKCLNSAPVPRLRPPPRALAQGDTVKAELVLVEQPLTDWLLLNYGNSENTEFLWSQLLRDQRLSFLIRAEAAVARRPLPQTDQRPSLSCYDHSLDFRNIRTSRACNTAKVTVYFTPKEQLSPSGMS
ncbi:unnamed protein product [Pleuronectes platessa]|uniref:Uncharacterized protein n=1 Tax=Pleuronectes platessa TaxID=8262 RepID=A0A9N7UIZ5_PLEPL|nr:unnamed protein product [Pleuronectes platessa]